MKNFSLSILLILMAMFVACDSGHSISEQVASAEMAMAESDVATTRNICDDLMGQNHESFDATELARLSILYMQLHDRTDDPDALQLATQCYREAFAENADSARIFFERLPVDQDKYAMTLSTLVSSLDNPGASLEDDDPYVGADSIGHIE